MQVPRPSPESYRRITFAAVVALGFIIVTGGAVRLTGSGLGCPDWPTCAHNRLVAPWEHRAMVEFVNRMITGIVSVAVILAALGSHFRVPRRRDLVRLSLGLVAGVVAQIVLGGITVKTHLTPPVVMAHFLLSMVILANAVVLHHRAGEPDGPPRPVVSRDLVLMGRLVAVSAAVAIFLGTVVTSSGPHGGDEHVERLPFLLPDVARLHGSSVMLFLVITVVTLTRLVRAGAPPHLVRQGEILLAVLVAQAAVGYVQYFTGVPVVLVGIHLAGAAAVWATTVAFLLGFSTREVPGRSREGEASEAVRHPDVVVATAPRQA